METIRRKHRKLTEQLWITEIRAKMFTVNAIEEKQTFSSEHCVSY